MQRQKLEIQKPPIETTKTEKKNLPRKGKRSISRKERSFRKADSMFHVRCTILKGSKEAYRSVSGTNQKFSGGKERHRNANEKGEGRSRRTSNGRDGYAKTRRSAPPTKRKKKGKDGGRQEPERRERKG